MSRKRKPKQSPRSLNEDVPTEDVPTEGLNLEFADEDHEDERAAADVDELLDETDADNEDTPLEAELLEARAEHDQEFLEKAPELEAEFEAAADEEEPPSELDDALSGTELESFESAPIEDVDVLAPEQIRSVVESILFSTDKPLSIAVMKQSFKGTQVRSKDIREALDFLTNEYDHSTRGFSLSEAGGGFQLRTKVENLKYLRQSIKVRPFRLSGPALEVLSIIAYKQPVTKNQVDEIRGVESGHLLRALMEKQLITFGERSDLPGKPMYYESTRKFLEIFSLRNLAELPSLSDIDQLIPEGIGEVEDKETLSDLTGQLSQEIGASYSEGEDELVKITDELTQITTSSDFFEQEKQRVKDKRDQERAQDIREALILGNPVERKDERWLERYEAAKAAPVVEAEPDAAEPVAEDASAEEPALELAPSEEPVPENLDI